jgi:hypothetical protein
MRLIIGSLAITLIGCSCPPPLAVNDCAEGNGFACDRANSPRVEQKPDGLKSNPATKSARAAIGSKTEHQPAAQRGDNAEPAPQKAKTAIVTKVSSSAQVEAKSDPVIGQAKIAIAEKMEVPASVEFVEIKRAVRNNTLGEPIDTVCGHVKGKTASGQNTGERPFVYIVKENDAYVVDDWGNLAAATAYRNICN